MAEAYVKFKNNLGLKELGIGIQEFKCVGASPPHDHPHVYLNMGGADFIFCPYCSTKFAYRTHLGRFETEPPGNLFEEHEVS